MKRRHYLPELAVMVPVLMAGLKGKASAQGSNPCAAATAKPCSLKGKVTSRKVYGPPGFGENKRPGPLVNILVLELTSPVHIACIRDHDSDPIKDCGITKRLHMYFVGPNEKTNEQLAKSSLNQYVTVVGTISEGVAPMDITPGVIDVTRLERGTSQ
jgi:hypothetical protein